LSNTGSGENYNNTSSYNENQKYVFRSMYRNTQSGALQDSDKNKFLLRGRYKSSGGDGIPIGALNVPGCCGYRCRKNFSRRIDYR
jgi:cell surface protein SprA